jgi:hypothetical protein
MLYDNFFINVFLKKKLKYKPFYMLYYIFML